MNSSMLFAGLFGAIIGVGLIWLGFNFRISPTLWIAAPAAYVPAAIAGALVAMLLFYVGRRHFGRG